MVARTKLCPVALLVITGMIATADAATVAYWRFEGDGVNAPTDGQFVTDTNGRIAVQNTGLLAIDSSGNGNHLYTWDNNATGHQYRTNNPGVVAQTGQVNNWSIQNNGNYPASMTWSRESSPAGTDVETIKPLTWTIEASVYQTANSGFQTFVGRDGNGVNASNSNAAPLYFQALNGNLRIQFADEAGNWYDLSDTTGAMALNTWYNVAAVSDGNTLKLFKDSGAGYVEVGSLALTGADRRLAYDDTGSNTAGDTQWSWSIGRGRYGTNDSQTQNHVDRFFGFIDEVRISDAALAPSQLLFSANLVPEPASILALSLVGLGLVTRRR